MAYEASIAAVYDLYFPPDRSHEADFWARLAGPAPACILEGMVGTAEVALHLAARGYDVTGVDLSAPMLAIARERLQAVPPEVAGRVRLLEGDICRVGLPVGRFDLAYVGNGSWNLLVAEADRLTALRNIRHALRPGGTLALNLFPPVRSSGRTEPRSFRPLRPAPDGLEVVKTSWMERDAATQVVHIHEEITVGDITYPHRLALQVLTPERVRAELEAAGFEKIGLYGSHDLTPYTDQSDHLIAIAG